MTKHQKIYRALHIKECCHCKSTSDLEVHHIDFNHSNNSPENLVALCRECHVEVHRKVSEVKTLVESSITQYVFDFTAYNQAAIQSYKTGTLEIIVRDGKYIARPKYTKAKVGNNVRKMQLYELMLHDPRIQFVIKTMPQKRT